MIRSACQGAGSGLCGVSQGSVGTKELHYVLRVLTPSACRSPKLFAECAKSALQINLPPPAKRGMDGLCYIYYQLIIASPRVSMKSIGADFLRPDILPGANYMCGMQYLNLTFRPEINLIQLYDFVCIISTQSMKVCLLSNQIFLRHTWVKEMLLF